MRTQGLVVVAVGTWLAGCAAAPQTHTAHDAAPGGDGSSRNDTGVVAPGPDATVTPADDDANGSTDDASASTDDTAVSTPDGATALVEDCATPWDDNDDGVANEGCTCTPGLVQPCFQRPEDRFEGMCRMGRQTCEGTGEFGPWGACTGSWLPLAAHMQQCEATETFSVDTAARAPVDILWFVDTSGSMSEETAAVNANLNTFASTMAASGLDFHVVMVARRGTGRLQVCVPAPLGSPNCGDTVRFKHLNLAVASTNGLRVVTDAYSQFSSFLRPDATKYFVAVTDDESATSADAFQTTVSAWPGFAGFVFHSIVGYETLADCPSMARRGGVYLTLTDRTHGERARVCSSDWTGIFTTFAHSIAGRANTWVLGDDARADTVQVWRVAADGTRTQLTSGWTYDPATHRVTIETASLPGPGEHVEVVYRPNAGSP